MTKVKHTSSDFKLTNDVPYLSGLVVNYGISNTIVLEIP